MPTAQSTEPSLLLIAEDGETWMVQALRGRFERTHRCLVRRAGGLRAADRSWMARMSAIFVRSRSPALLRVLEPLEARGVLMVNGVHAIRSARHRATALSLVATHGVPVASDFEGPLTAVPFRQAVLKRRYDDGRSTPVLYVRGVDAVPRSHVVYAQQFIRSAWEHKIYVVGDALFAFEQRPTMLFPAKLATRRRVAVDPVLGLRARRAAEAVGLEVAGIDFLVDRGEPRVTDVNSNQGLHTFAEGYQALETHLRGRLRGTTAKLQP